MIRPSQRAYTLGNPLSVGAITLTAIAIFWQVWLGLLPDFMAGVGLVAILFSWDAAKQLLEYRAWKRRWDDLGPKGRR